MILLLNGTPQGIARCQGGRKRCPPLNALARGRPEVGPVLGKIISVAPRWTTRPGGFITCPCTEKSELDTLGDMGQRGKEQMYLFCELSAHSVGGQLIKWYRSQRYGRGMSLRYKRDWGVLWILILALTRPSMCLPCIKASKESMSQMDLNRLPAGP